KSESDATGREYVAGEPSHSLYQIIEVVAVRIDRPDDVAHRVDQLARGGRNHRKCLIQWAVALARLALGNFACHRNQREVRADVVVQVGCYPSADSLDFKALRQLIAIDRISN